MPRKPDQRKSGHEIDDLLADLGGRISHHRKAKGLSQVELGARLQVSQNLISAYELGKVRIGADAIVALARALHVSADELLGLKAPKVDPGVPSRRLLKRLARFESLPKRQQAALLQTIDAVLQAAGG